MTLISKKLESLEGKNYICIFGSSCVHYHEHICVCSRLVQNIPVRAPGNYATPLHEKAIYAYLRSQYHHVHSSWVQESAGRSPITRRRIANRKSTKHQLLHAIQHRRNQKPTRARLLGPNEPEITQTKKEVQDCLPGESDCRISAPIPCPLLSAMGSGCSPESPTRSSSSAPH